MRKDRGLDIIITVRKAYSVNKLQRRSTKLKRLPELGFQVGKLINSNGRSLLIDVTVSIDYLDHLYHMVILQLIEPMHLPIFLSNQCIYQSFYC